MCNNFKEKFKDLYKKDENGIYVVKQTFLKPMILCLKEKDDFHFLADITAVDYLESKKQLLLDLLLSIY